MNKRKLYLPRGLDVPASLQPIVSETVYTGAICPGMGFPSSDCGVDQVRLVLGPLCSGSLWQRRAQRRGVSGGGRVWSAATHRSLGAYLGDRAFRRINDALLSQGESVHTLQRAIYSGPIRGCRHTPFSGHFSRSAFAIENCPRLLDFVNLYAS